MDVQTPEGKQDAFQTLRDDAFKPTTVANNNHFNEIVDNMAFNIGSSEMEDKEVYVYFVFNKNNDYVLLKSKGNVTYFEYDKGYVFNVLLSISQWKNTIKSF